MIPADGRFHKIMAGSVLLALFAACPARSQVTGQEVRQSVAQGIALIKSQQQGDGHWPRYGGYEGGTTGLATLALINAGLGMEDPAVQKGVDAIAKLRNEKTYVVSLKCQVLAAADPKGLKYRKHLEDAVKWLIQAQTKVGMWGYRQGQGRGDNSNTQFALLGLHEAAKVGVEVPEPVWRRSGLHFTNTQLPDGSWGYNYHVGQQGLRNRRINGYGSMTTAALASLYICGQELFVGGRKILVNGAWPSCGKYSRNIVLAKGLEWMARNFSVKENPGRGKGWLYYYLYGMERVGMISGQRNFGPHDWYRKGAAFLVAQQNQRGWGRVRGRGIPDTAFALLFLAKGNRPVLFQKVKWSGQFSPQAWNRNIHDLEKLTRHVSDAFGRPVTWQSASLELPLEQLRVSPILYLTGHDFPQFTQAQKRKIQQFVDSGGTLLAEACCSSARFRVGFQAMAKELWPDYPLRPLPASHPVFGSFYDLEHQYDLEGIDIGCRTGVFFSPRPLSVLWEMEDLVQNNQKLSEFAFHLGTNIAAYATGKEQLANKLDEVILPREDSDTRRAEVPRGAVRIARLYHNGDYNADPKALTELTGLLRDQAGVDVVTRERQLRVTDETIYEYPVVFMTGHYDFEMSEEEIKALRTYLKRGGFLFADSCCGRERFDQAFRKMVSKLFPEAEFKKLDRDHPILTGKVGKRLGRMTYRKILAQEKAKAGDPDPTGTNHPPIYTIVLDGRVVLAYSPYDFSCALEGDNPYSCRGYVDEDGRNLAMNLVLYAITY